MAPPIGFGLMQGPRLLAGHLDRWAVEHTGKGYGRILWEGEWSPWVRRSGMPLPMAW